VVSEHLDLRFSIYKIKRPRRRQAIASRYRRIDGSEEVATMYRISRRPYHKHDKHEAENTSSSNITIGSQDHTASEWVMLQC